MKVGIINHWMVNNYGAVLLAYALEKKLLKMGYDVETISWLPDEVRTPWKTTMIKKVGLVHYALRLGYFFVFILPREKSFRSFRKLFHASKNIYTDKSISKISEVYDKIIIGGDQLWNCKVNYYNENNFLPFVQEKDKKIVYAASLSQDNLDPSIHEKFRELAEGFSYVTVREKRAKEIIESITNLTVQRITDSAFLLNNKEWHELSTPPRLKRKYIFVYQVQSDVCVVKYAKYLSMKTGYEIVYCPFPLKKQIKCHRHPYLPIEDWLGYIENAEFVITDAFHGAVFSLIFNKEFWVEISEYGKDTGSRIINLLDIYGLQNRLLNEKSFISLSEMKKIDYSHINAIIEREINTAEIMIKAMLQKSAAV